MRVALSITRSYRPNWGLWEGVRELIQNAKDAETEFNAPMSISHSGDTLTMRNDDCSLSHSALLLGETSKADRTDLIGQWGDGLKIGILALVRSGYEVRIETGDEIWKPALEYAEEFGGAEVLVVNIRKSRVRRFHVEVIVKGITAEQWAPIARKFRWLPGTPRANVSKTMYGDLLKDEPGAMYVRGIFVENVANMEYGYDFNSVELDVDRQTMKYWSRDSACREVLHAACVTDDSMAPKLFTMLCAGTKDVEDFRYGTVTGESLRADLKQLWIDQHGESVIPISCEDENETLVHLGVRGVVVPAAAVKVFGDIVGTSEKVQAELAFSTKEVLDLDAIEHGDVMLEALIRLETAGYAVSLDKLEVVEFLDPKILGQFEGGSGRIKIASKVLARGLAHTIVTLVHEVAHGLEGNGRTHEQSIEKIMVDLLDSML